MPNIMITTSIFGHIELDSELSGRYGVQGNTFENTFGYFHQYLQTLASPPPQLAKLVVFMEDLVTREISIKGLSDRSNLTTFSMNATNDVMKLNPGCDFMLPGGWQNADGGHAMIYQFKKKNDGGLIFSIYNSGAGLGKHEKISSTANERFFPVKVYSIPAPVDSKELSILISRLIMPNLLSHPDRKTQAFDAEKLYENIEKSMFFLNAESIHASQLIPEHATTAGHISGICAQRSIHQMLKINFDRLSDYQRFIFDFKLYALNDFIATHQPPRHKEITRLIQDAIIHNLNLLQEACVFTNTDEQDQVVHELQQLQTLISEQEATHITVPQIRPTPAQYVWHINAWTMEPFYNAVQLPPIVRHPPPPLVISGGTNLSDQLDALIIRCEELKANYPIWVIEQIEQAILQMPLPTRPIKREKGFALTDFYDDIPFYSSITSLEEMGTKIELLQQVYAQAFENLAGGAQLSNRLVTQFSLLALRDYFDVQQAKLQKKPSFHVPISEVFACFVKWFRYCSFVATHNPQLDQRWKQLMRLYETPDGGQYPYDFYESYYNALLDTEPTLKQKLNRFYNQAYEKDDSTLHVLLRQQNLSALWYFFEQLEEGGQLIKNSLLVSDHDFDVLIKKIQHQIGLEQSFLSCFKPFLETEITLDKALKIGALSSNVSPQGWLWMSTPGHYLHVEAIKFSKHNTIYNITQHQYKLSDSPALNALLADYPDGRPYYLNWHRKPENEIQLSSAGKQTDSIINKDDFYNRELFHLRLSPANQIDFTLDYFKANPDKLSDPNIQRYMEANIFEPGLLCNALDRDAREQTPILFNRLDEFIHKGLQQFNNQDGLLSHESIFFIRLGVSIDCYTARYYSSSTGIKVTEEMDPRLRGDDNRWVGRLETKQKYLSALITIQTDPEILSSLHALYFQTAVAHHQQDKSRDAHFAETFSSYFYYQAKSNSHLQDDTASRIEQERAEYHFRLWMLKIPNDQMNALIKPILEHLGIDVRGLTLTGTYPEFLLRDRERRTVYTINAELGRVFQANKAFSAVPLNIQNHPIMRRLGLEHESSCFFIFADGKTIEFITPETSVRILMGNHKRLTVQKKWMLGGRDDWYELQFLTEQQEQFFGLGETSRDYRANKLPALFTDGSILAWVNYSGHSFLARNNQPIYQETVKGQFEQLNAQGMTTGYILTDRQQDFVQFEDSAFFSVTLDKRTKTKGTVYFARYGLSLIIADQAITLSDTTYTLFPAEKSTLGGGIAALYFTDGIHQQCIIPVQPFYVASSPPAEKGDYYQLTHDISGHVASKKLKKYWEDTKLAKKDQPLWSYEHSGTTVTYPLVNGEPRPNTAADALYLCYLYLGTHNIKKAWAVLDDLSQRLSLEGTSQELMYLSWIIKAMPVILGDKDNDAKLKTPHYVSCQLKALAIYTEFLAQDKKPELPSPSGMDLTQANGYYQALCAAEVIVFYHGLPGTIYELYTQFQKMERHLSKKYMLPDTARKSLLNHYEQCLPDERTRAVGALGYEKRRLNLKSLLAEYNRLDAIETSSPTTCPLQFTKRKASIESQLAKQLPVMKRSTALKWIPIDLSLREDLKINESLLPENTKKIFSEWKENVFNAKSSGTPEQAMATLSSEIDQHDFILHFPRYLNMARNKKDPHRKQLSNFCENYLKGHRHAPLDKQDSNIPYLTNILYRLLNNPSCGRDSGSVVTLSELTDRLKTCSLPPILVCQAQDVFQEILATSNDIWEDLKQAASIPIPMKTPALIQGNSLTVAALIEKICATTPLHFKAFCDRYRLAEADYQAQLTNLLTTMDKTPTLAALRQNEIKAGDLKYTCIQNQRDAAQACFSDKTIRDLLLHRTTGSCLALEIRLDKRWKIVWELANQMPNDTRLARRFRMELASEKRQELAKSELMTLYLRADLATYIERTGLSIEQCETLHAHIHECVTLEVNYKHLTRLKKALKDKEEPHLIANILMSENHPEAQHDPALMLFQYEDEKLLRPRQIEVLTNLLSTPDNPYQVKESVEKIIMGGGKSKVLLPLLAAKKANGLNLVMIEVPRALLATNHVDLNSTSQRLFHQKAHRFEFDRDSDCSPHRLEQIYQQFVDIKTNKDYLVTTGESMQSLALKYLELLLSRPEQPDEQKQWEKQVFWAGKITQLIKQNGDVVIDEVHQGLLLKKKLNYTFGSPTAISPVLIQHSCELYQFLDKLSLEEATINHSTLKARMENQWSQDILPRLLDALCDDPDSPLQTHIKELRKRYGEDVVDDLKAYLNNDEKSEPFIEKLMTETQALQEALAFYKEQLFLLPQTLGRHYREHYGPSKQPEKRAIKRTLAIPYSANEKPNERSRFGNPMETINYSIQSLLMEGLSKELLMDVIEQWQTEARSELQKDYIQYQYLDQTPTAQGVASLLAGTGFTLQTINLRNAAHVNQLVKHLKHNKALLFHALEKQVLRQISTEPAILHSDAYNHLDIYHSAQGLSGTPWNQSTYHQRLQYNHNTSLGTDGYIQCVLKGKGVAVRGVPFTTCGDYLLQIFNGRNDIRAIIDISAAFAGLSNLDVALELGAFTATHQANIKYILYFNDRDILCALDVAHPTRQSIELGTSDPDEIDQKLNCKPDDRLTYYDQSHTIGTDLKQAPNSRGIVLVNEKTHLQSFLQGCMRMRGLEEQQSVEIIVPTALQETSFDGLIESMATNELNQLTEDNFVAAMAKMQNIVRQDLLQRLSSLEDDDIETRYRWGQAFKRYFIEIKKESLFEQYGGISREIDTSLLLDQQHQWLMADWKKCLASIDTMSTSDETDLLAAAMQGVIDQSLPLCKPKVVSRAKSGCMDLEVEVQKEKEILKEEEKLQEEERYNRALKAVDYDPTIAQRLCRGVFKDTTTLTDLCAPAKKDEKPVAFSSNLVVSPNYSKVYKGQKHMLGFYLKPVHAILFRMKNSQLTACIVSNEDAEKISAILLKNNPKDIWLSTTQHTRLAGNRPNHIMSNPEYQILMEQVRFFNGECDGLLEQTTPFLWLKEGIRAKFTFFEKHILPYRETTSSEWHRLRSALSNKTAGFDYIKNHAFDDLSDFNWEDAFPNALPADIGSFKSLAAAFSDANKGFEIKPLVLNEYIKKALLPPAAIAYLKNHLELLNQYKNLLTWINKSSVEHLALNTLNDSQKSILQAVLHLDINVLLNDAESGHELQFNDLHRVIRGHIDQTASGKSKFFLANTQKANTAGGNPDLRELQAAIEQLRIGAFELFIESLKETNQRKSQTYCDEADAALLLYQSLNNLTQSYTGDKVMLSTNVATEVKKYEPVLRHDYRLKQILYDILNAIFILVSLAKYAKTGQFNFRLFDARSKNTAIIEEINNKNVPKNDSNRGPS